MCDKIFNEKIIWESKRGRGINEPVPDDKQFSNLWILIQLSLSEEKRAKATGPK